MDGSSERQSISRRDLLKGAAAAVSLSVISTSLGGCETTPEKPKLITTGVVNVGPARDYPAGTVSMAYAPTHGIALANDSGTVLAININCTHKHCTTKWDNTKNQFIFPCHGSQFGLMGQVVKGPATQPLSGIAAMRNADGTLSVNLDKLFDVIM